MREPISMAITPPIARTPLTHHLDLGDEERHAEDEQQEAGPVHRQALEGVEGQDEADPPMTPGRIAPGLDSSKKMPSMPAIIRR